MIFLSGCLADWIDVIQPGWLAGGLATHMAFWQDGQLTNWL